MYAVVVVVPVLNEVEHLPPQAEALLMELATAGVESHIAFCDNGSTDGTRALLEQLASAHDHVHFVDASSGPRSASAARNRAVREVPALFYVFCDADDIVQPGWLNAHLEALGRGAPVTTGAATSSLTGRTLGAPGLWGHPFAYGGNMGVRREVFEEVGLFLEHLRTAEDAEFTFRAARGGHELEFLPTARIWRRDQSGLLAAFSRHISYGRGQRLLVRRGDAPVSRSRAWALTVKSAAAILLRGPSLIRHGRGPEFLATIARLTGFVAG